MVERAAGFFVIALVLGICTGWLSSLTPKPFRYWARHPWIVFWSCGLLVTGILLVPARVSLPLPPIVAALPLGVIFCLSAVQGLRVTWYRSHWKAALIIVLSFMIDVLRLVSSSPSFFEEKLYFGLLNNPAWVLAAYIAHYISRRLETRRNVTD